MIALTIRLNWTTTDLVGFSCSRRLLWQFQYQSRLVELSRIVWSDRALRYGGWFWPLVRPGLLSCVFHYYIARLDDNRMYSRNKIQKCRRQYVHSVLLPICCRHRENWLHSTWQTSYLRQSESTEKPRQTHGNSSRKPLPVCCRHEWFCSAGYSWNLSSKHVDGSIMWHYFI